MSRQIAVVASLYPAPFNAKRPGFSPQPSYDIEKCTDLSQPKICVVHMQEERPYMGLDRVGYQTWDADAVADDLINSWGGGALGRLESQEAIPAIWRSDGAKQVTAIGGNVWVIPPEEIEFHRKRQDKVLNNLVLMARFLFNNKQNPLPVMRDAADMLKIQGEAWQHEMTSDARFECPYCKAVNKNGAAVCQNCNNVINSREFERIREMIQRMDNAVEGLPDDEQPPAEKQGRGSRAKAAEKEKELTPA